MNRSWIRAVECFLLFSAAGLTASPSVPAAEPVSEAWVARYNRTTSRNESANAIALDPTGNVYVVGTNSGGVSDSDITTVKYDAGGNQLWATSYSQTPDSIDHGLFIAAGSSDSVYVAGQSRGATGYYYDMILIKYDSAGNRLWVSIFNGPGNMDDRPKGLIVGASGSVYVTIESDGDIVTVKYGSLGNLLWSARYSGAGNGVDQPNAIALDVAENVYVTGGSDGDMITIKYDSNGNQLWATHYNGPSAGAEIANHLTIDPAGNVYVVGESYGTGTVYDFVTIKYDVVGNQLWAVRYDGPDHRLDEANFVAVDGSGYVYVTGNSYYQEVDRSGPEIVTIKYDSNGSQLWQNRYRAAGTSANGVSGLAIDAIGNVYISGFSFGEDESQSILLKYDTTGNLLQEILYNDGGSVMAVDSPGNAFLTGGFESDATGSDFVTIQYDAFGNRLWKATYDSSIAISDRGLRIARDGLGNIYVTGPSSLDSHHADLVTVKYDTDGNQLWTAILEDVSGDSADMATDESGNVYVGATSNPPDQRPSEILVVKYDMAGNRVWTASYGGTDNNSKGLAALAVDSSGDVYVTGWVAVYLGSDIITIKYDSSGNRLWAARTTGGYGEPSSLVVDGWGNVYVTGHIAGGGVNAAFSTFKYDVAGNPLWVSHYGGSGMSNAIALDVAGNVYVTGWRQYDRTRAAMTTIKYDANGVELWVSDYLGSASGTNEAFAIAVDAAGNVCVAGRGSYYGSNSDMVTIKYDPMGSRLWVASYSTADGYAQASAIAIDSSGSVYITGYSDGGGTRSEYTTLKYDGAGNQVWAASYNGTGNGADMASSLVVDESGSVFVTGSSLGQGTGSDCVTIKYLQPGYTDASAGNSGRGGGGCLITTTLH